MRGIVPYTLTLREKRRLRVFENWVLREYLEVTEERRLRVFENWVLRRVFGGNRDEVTEE